MQKTFEYEGPDRNNMSTSFSNSKYFWRKGINSNMTQQRGIGIY